MSVLNCKIIEGRHVQLLNRKRKRKPKRVVGQQSSTQDSAEDDKMFRPVSCSMCNTEVAVIDKDEVYHFHNVLPSFV